MIHVLVIVYRGCEPFIDDYIRSLSKQSNSEFALLIISDGLDHEHIERKLKEAKIDQFEILDSYERSTFSKNRERGLLHLFEKKCDKIVFTDIDDTYNEKRIEFFTDKLDHNDFVIHDFQIWVEGKRIDVFKGRSVPSRISCDFLLKHNVAGFGNSGIKGEIIKDLLPIPSDIIAVDWWLATVSSILHGEIAFFESSLSTYRQHTQNLIGMNRGTNSQKVKIGLKVKRIHYRRLAENERIPRSYRNVFRDLQKEVDELEGKLIDEDKMNKYIEAVSVYLDGRIPLWWEDIMPARFLESAL